MTAPTKIPTTLPELAKQLGDIEERAGADNPAGLHELLDDLRLRLADQEGQRRADSLMERAIARHERDKARAAREAEKEAARRPRGRPRRNPTAVVKQRPKWLPDPYQLERLDRIAKAITEQSGGVQVPNRNDLVRDAVDMFLKAKERELKLPKYTPGDGE